MQYEIRCRTGALDGGDHLPAAVWEGANALTLDHFMDHSSDHRPRVTARLVYDDEAVYVHFTVDDQYVRCVSTEYQSSVCRDSCAEFFVEPVPGKGYFNFETNAMGTLLLYYIENQDMENKAEVPWELASMLTIDHSVPGVIDPEITDAMTWTLGSRIPYAVFEPYVGTVSPRPGMTWRANLYKCADQTSHPHWAMWAPIAGSKSFHEPDQFGTLTFA